MLLNPLMTNSNCRATAKALGLTVPNSALKTRPATCHAARSCLHCFPSTDCCRRGGASENAASYQAYRHPRLKGLLDLTRSGTAPFEESVPSVWKCRPETICQDVSFWRNTHTATSHTPRKFSGGSHQCFGSLRGTLAISGEYGGRFARNDLSGDRRNQPALGAFWNQPAAHSPSPCSVGHPGRSRTVRLRPCLFGASRRCHRGVACAADGAAACRDLWSRSPP
jgi:hypothetical protein